MAGRTWGWMEEQGDTILCKRKIIKEECGLIAPFLYSCAKVSVWKCMHKSSFGLQFPYIMPETWIWTCFTAPPTMSTSACFEICLGMIPLSSVTEICVGQILVTRAGLYSGDGRILSNKNGAHTAYKPCALRKRMYYSVFVHALVGIGVKIPLLPPIFPYFPVISRIKAV